MRLKKFLRDKRIHSAVYRVDASVIRYISITLNPLTVFDNETDIKDVSARARAVLSLIHI